MIAGLVDWVVNSGQLKQSSGSGDKGSDRVKNNDQDSIDESMETADVNESGESQSPVRVIKKKRRDIPAEEKKICLWVLEDGTACGKTFTKFDRYLSRLSI